MFRRKHNNTTTDTAADFSPGTWGEAEAEEVEWDTDVLPFDYSLLDDSVATYGRDPSAGSNVLDTGDKNRAPRIRRQYDSTAQFLVVILLFLGSATGLLLALDWAIERDDLQKAQRASELAQKREQAAQLAELGIGSTVVAGTDGNPVAEPVLDPDLPPETPQPGRDIEVFEATTSYQPLSAVTGTAAAVGATTAPGPWSVTGPITYRFSGAPCELTGPLVVFVDTAGLEHQSGVLRSTVAADQGASRCGGSQVVVTFGLRNTTGIWAYSEGVLTLE